MLQTIESINNVVNNFIWGVPAMICIIGVGLYLSLRTGFVQIRKFPYALKTTLGRIFKKKEASDGSMTPFQAVCTALAGTVGTGNIAGVAGAIAIGGPGAVFWMWVSALLGMCTKFTEVTLAVHFRERNRHGDYVGGPMYYIKNGLGKNWRFLAVLYSAFGVLTVFGTGNATQVNTITTAIDTALINFNVISESSTGRLNLILGIVITLLVGMVLLGGIKRIGSVSEKLVPFMALFYIVLALGVVVLNIGRVPAVFHDIVYTHVGVHSEELTVQSEVNAMSNKECQCPMNPKRNHNCHKYDIYRIANHHLSPISNPNSLQYPGRKENHKTIATKLANKRTLQSLGQMLLMFFKKQYNV